MGKQAKSTSHGCVYCVYEMPPMTAEKWRKRRIVSTAKRTVRTARGDRDLCERHALEAEKRVTKP